MNKDIEPKNAKGQRHGYWEYYFNTGKLLCKCVYINGKENGFEEWYNFDGKLTYKRYHL